MARVDTHRKLNIDIKNCFCVDLKEYILSNPYNSEECALYDPERGGIWTIRPEKIFNDSWRNYMEKDLGILLDIAQIFFRQPHYQHPGAHVDVSRDGTLHGGAINWCLDQDTADMVWYAWPDHEPVYTERTETDKNMEWPLDNLQEIDRTCVGTTPKLIRTDLPHTVYMRENPRWLVSLRTLSAKTWQEHCDLTKELIQ